MCSARGQNQTQRLGECFRDTDKAESRVVPCSYIDPFHSVPFRVLLIPGKTPFFGLKWVPEWQTGTNLCKLRFFTCTPFVYELDTQMFSTVGETPFFV